MKTEWKKYLPHHILSAGSNGFYQKCVMEIGEYKMYVEVVEWEFQKKCWELEIQIPHELSITGMTINIKNFNYDKLNFKKIEKDAVKIINLLIKK